MPTLWLPSTLILMVLLDGYLSKRPTSSESACIIALSVTIHQNNRTAAYQQPILISIPSAPVTSTINNARGGSNGLGASTSFSYKTKVAKTLTAETQLVQAQQKQTLPWMSQQQRVQKVVQSQAILMQQHQFRMGKEKQSAQDFISQSNNTNSKPGYEKVKHEI